MQKLALGVVGSALTIGLAVGGGAAAGAQGNPPLAFDPDPATHGEPVTVTSITPCPMPGEPLPVDRESVSVTWEIHEANGPLGPDFDTEIIESGPSEPINEDGSFSFEFVPPPPPTEEDHFHYLSVRCQDADGSSTLSMLWYPEFIDGTPPATVPPEEPTPTTTVPPGDEGSSEPHLSDSTADPSTPPAPAVVGTPDLTG